MMLPGYPAPNWCLEVEWETEANQANKGFDKKVQRLFSYTGANGSKTQEIWLLVYPQDDEKILVVPPPRRRLPIIERADDRPAIGSKYSAIFVDGLGEDQYVVDVERRKLVAYDLIELNKLFRVPVVSLLSGAPDINTNHLLDGMGYVIQFQDVHK